MCDYSKEIVHAEYAFYIAMKLKAK